jgi:hypothetical protein
MRENATEKRCRSSVVAGAAAGALLLCSAASSQAASSAFTFAQFQEAVSGPGANQFAYLDNGTNAELVTDSGAPGTPIPATFSYLGLPGLPAALQGPQSATVRLVSSTTSPVMTALAGTVGSQEITGATGLNLGLVNSLEIERTTPIGGLSNLLTVTFSGAVFGGISGRTPQLSANASLGDTVTYSSDFLSFAGTSLQNFSVTFSSWTTNSDGNGLEINPADNFFSSATAAGTGTFAVAVPEPTMLSLGIFGVVGMLARRRRTAL